ncbi:sigma-54 dependent transcriptional regulator [Corallococcus sp. BB11-1]|uniref:sigma-54-dependent transcriptional regulator n=1 Tax=Corallococcus sp. BB11-1 TaxID=2996783 RepID=UPI0022703AEF|nr:sigma-54 dependent transcriptional regulator [Corallococcus sp. BB11-1]MCY1030288.1 sigma-54 dependent transcriptional regulator [Corallococcus sp. BB11-1]
MTHESPAQQPHVLLVDDDLQLAELMSMRMTSRGYHVTVESEGKGALRRLAQERVDAMVLDLRLEDMDGMDVLRAARQSAPELSVIMLTAHGSIETAVQAMQEGAYGFLTKPFHDHELMQKLTHALERSRLRREVAELRRRMGEDGEPLLLGTSDAISRVREVIARIAPTDATVLLTGESGTGKELAARMLHLLSRRNKERFVAVNCGALPPELLESELFGHVKGAFSGAVREREGLFGAANGGTLFLDEVGEASPSVQVKLLRVLQEQRLTRVGADVEEPVDVRVVAATNRDLAEEVAAKRFRQDLYFRLHVVPIELPPLRERIEDIPLLAQLFLERTANRYGLRPPRLSPATVELLQRYGWPGNVRELIHEMEAAVLLAGTDELQPRHVPRLGQALERPPAGSAQLPGVPGGTADLPSLREARDAFERAYLAEAMRRSSGSVSAAARMAGRNRSDFYDLLKRHGLSAADFKETSEDGPPR